MDKNTQREIEKINASIPFKLRRYLIERKEDKELTETKERIKWYTEKYKWKKGKKLVDNFPNTSYDKVNPRIAKEIELYIKTKIEQAINNGKIPPASKSEYLRFLKKIHQ